MIITRFNSISTLLSHLGNWYRPDPSSSMSNDWNRVDSAVLKIHRKWNDMRFSESVPRAQPSDKGLPHKDAELGTNNGPVFNEDEARFLKERGVHYVFPPEVLYQSYMTSIPAAELQSRPQVEGYTIDENFLTHRDDAIWVERTRDGFKAMVSIADVAALVPYNSPVDIEAKARIANAYFRMQHGYIPMLPAEIRTLAELAPMTKRLAITIEMTFDDDGRLLAIRPFESMLVSRRALTYKQADGIKNSSDDPLRQNINDAHELSYRLFKNRQKVNPGIVFDLEKNIVSSENGQIKILGFKQRFSTYLVVQELTIAVNRAAAEYLSKNDYPVIFWCHDLSLYDPSSERTNTMFYSFENRGHSGLGVDVFSHFSTPLRRYAALFNMRLLKMLLHKDTSGIKKIKDETAFESFAQYLTYHYKTTFDTLRALALSKRIKRQVPEILSTVSPETNLSPIELVQLMAAGPENKAAKDFLETFFKTYDNNRKYPPILSELRKENRWKRMLTYISLDIPHLEYPGQIQTFGKRIILLMNGKQMTTHETGKETQAFTAKNMAAYFFLRDYLSNNLVEVSEINTPDIAKNEGPPKNSPPTYLDMVLFYVKRLGVEQPFFTVEKKEDRKYVSPKYGGIFRAMGTLKIGDNEIMSFGYGNVSEADALEKCHKDMLAKLREAMRS